MIKKTVTVALAIGTVLAGTSAAHATATRIPKYFLLTERAAAAGAVVEGEEWWKISDSLSRPLEFNPCRSKAKGKPRDGRVAMRTITYLSSAPSGSSEQLVLYANARSAQAAFRKLRADLARCSKPAVVKRDRFGYVTKPLRVGDEALSVAGHEYGPTGRRLSPSDDLAVVARRGAALFLYTANARGRGAKKEITAQAGKMAKKVCGLPGVCP
ncbi:hypothetical protein Nocox_37785 [Nonomuraea coxensis DSM 45129]|uniref:PknH-like extracellular domain-containing protein n=1 Tax=Nonomuraea coxensis DSM 45129 TaxID=1122611 RepID=A0ABX8UBG7_9ACTN|nr:hypothetical protein [Nonomuraea coxensis]QYC45109.1 hypothetical protein Nocox_37785 [Nonomuraea coxensis DSM 45129]